jgi:hypothetical protein
MAGACEFDGLWVAGTETGSFSADSITVTLLKGATPQPLTTTVAVPGDGTTASAHDNTHKFTVAAGDIVSIRVSQVTSGNPVVRLNVTSRCRCGGGGTQPACN